MVSKKEMKNTRKNLMLGFLAFFIFVFAINFVSAANQTGPIGDWFTSWDDGNFSTNIAKYLLWALVSMLVYGISDKFPGLEGKEFIKIPFALIVGFLSMAYITPEEVFSMMTAYNAMGFVLSTVIPFLILTFFTFDLSGKEGTPKEQVSYNVLATVMWVGFSLFMVVRAITATKDSTFLTWGIAAAAIVMTVSIRPLMAYIGKQVHKEKLDTLVEVGDMMRKENTNTIRSARAKIKAMEEEASP